jgi:UDP-2-acetamido-3-amino-2,3-dideoxy-glucuronate N-acetyltransferase
MIATDVLLGENVDIPHPDLVNLYGCRIGDSTRVGPFVEIQRGVQVGANCKISSHSFICTGVAIENEVFVGHGVMFTNDLYPRATNSDGTMKTDDDWEVIPTLVKSGAAIGSNASILAGITIGEGALIGAGSVVVHDVPSFAIVSGSPARVMGDTRNLRNNNLITAEESK